MTDGDARALVLLLAALWGVTLLWGVWGWCEYRRARDQWRRFVEAQKQRSLVTTAAGQQCVLTRAHHELARMRKEGPGLA